MGVICALKQYAIDGILNPMLKVVSAYPPLAIDTSHSGCGCIVDSVGSRYST